MFSPRHANQLKSYLVQVAQFRNEASAALLEELSQKLDSVQVIYLSQSLSEYYCKHYQDLILSLWEKHLVIGYYAEKMLIQDAPEKAAKSFAIGLRKPGKHLLMESFSARSDLQEKMLPMMLEIIKMHQAAELESVCEHFILNNPAKEILAFIQILKFVKENDLKETSAVLSQQLKGRCEAYRLYYLSDALLAFGDQQDRVLLIKRLQQDQAVWDWGFWSADFRNLIEKYQLNITLKP